MSFVGSIGVLMKNSALLPWIKSGFGGTEKMLTGKKFPMITRAFRFAMLKLLRNHVEEIESFEILTLSLNHVGCKFHNTCNVDVNLHS